MDRSVGCGFEKGKTLHKAIDFLITIFAEKWAVRLNFPGKKVKNCMTLSFAAQIATSPMAAGFTLVAADRLQEGERNRIIEIGKRFFVVGFYAGMFYAASSVPEASSDSMGERRVRSLLWFASMSLKTAIEAGALAINVASAASIFNRLFPQ